MTKNLLLLLTTILVLLSILEIILRIVDYNSSLLVPRDDSDFIEQLDVVNYRYIPNQEFRVKNSNYNISVRTNSNGYRDNEWLPEDNSFKIMFLGDSYTAGFGVEEDHRYSNHLGMIPDENKKTKSFQIFNAAVSGYNLNQMIETFYLNENIISPDLVVLGLYLEGLDRIEDPYIYYEGFSLKKSKSEFAYIIDDKLYITHSSSKIIQYIEKTIFSFSFTFRFLIEKVIQIKNDYFLKKNFEGQREDLDSIFKIIKDFSSALTAKGVKLIILPVIQHLSNGDFGANIKSSYDFLNKNCIKENISFVDILPTLLIRINNHETLWIKNDPHWNKIAHKIAANCLNKEIQLLIKDIEP